RGSVRSRPHSTLSLSPSRPRWTSAQHLHPASQCFLLQQRTDASPARRTGVRPYNCRVNPPQDDVLILGGGAIGLATALSLLEAGRGVRVLEAGRVGGATSHGNCGTITPSHAPPLAAPGVPLRALRWM